MTKKDYQLIARELKTQHEMLGFNSGHINGNPGDENTPTVYETSCKMWAATLKADNPRFDADIFLKACGL